MFCKVNSADIQGIHARMIQIEADISDGLPIFIMVGYLASAVKEARERVRIALKNTGIRFPVKRITINLSPADLRKEGTTFDLPIAISVLAAYGQIPFDLLKDYLVVGELGLDGSILPIHGCLSMVDEAVKHGIKKCIVPKANAVEAGMVKEAVVYGVSHLSQLMDFFRGEKKLEQVQTDASFLCSEKKCFAPDFADVIGQQRTKRALEIAVSGMHNILMMGPPGSGKTMLAKCVPSIMPDLSLEERIEITKIYSSCGMLEKDMPLVKKRPFRSPHHTITDSALMGGGKRLHPGEVTLASGGVLFLDEFLEFKRSTLELLRQPLEDRKVFINRVNYGCEYPADFMMIAAANPCKCGYYPDRNRCHCSEGEVRKYLSHVSRPVLDRIDLCTQTDMLLPGEKAGESSETIRRRVEMARNIQEVRYEKEEIHFNAGLSAAQIKKFCSLTKDAADLLEYIFSQGTVTMRGKNRILKTARTIADLSGEEKIREEHMGEAIKYRVFGKEYWEAEV